jgi:hypothetical protein
VMVVCCSAMSRQCRAALDTLTNGTIRSTPWHLPLGLGERISLFRSCHSDVRALQSRLHVAIVLIKDGRLAPGCYLVFDSACDQDANPYRMQ